MTSTQQQTEIHPTAIVAKGAELGVGVQVGPYSTIGPRVRIHDQVEIISHVVISGRTTIGARTCIWPFASIGTKPQDLKYKGEDTEFECGEDNEFREYVNISIGTEGGGGRTVIGSKNLLMNNTHVAHDCIIRNHCILATNAAIAGHIEVKDHAILGGHSAVHQFCKIGEWSLVAGGAIVVQDVPPFVIVAGNHAKPSGLNTTGLKRAGYKKDLIDDIKKMYRLLYRSNLRIDEVLEAIKKQINPSKERDSFVQFLKESSRGVCR